MIRIIFFMFLLAGLVFLVYQFIAWLKYRQSLYYKIDQDVEKLNDETKSTNRKPSIWKTKREICGNPFQQSNIRRKM